MNPLKAEKLFSLMRQFGVEHFKSQEIEIKMGSLPQSPDALQKIRSQVESMPVSHAEGPKTAASAPPVEMEIPHHENEVAKLLKLSDEQLVDALFPEGAPVNANN